MRTLLLSTVAAVALVDGYVHGLWANRWQDSRELEQAVARLERLPLKLGDWRGEARPLERRVVAVAGFAGYLHRRYERHDGAAVSVLLACGRSGPLSVHAPEVCYGGAGFRLSGQAVRHVAGAQGPAAAEFWKAKFSKETAAPVHLRVLWSWHARGAWRAADSPRLEFAGLPVLHKMYVTCELTGADERQQDAVCAEFLSLLLPELQKAALAQP